MLNQGYAYETTIGGDVGGRSVLVFLAERYRHSSAEQWLQCLLNGEVSLDGVEVHGSEVPLPGQMLVWRRPPWTEPEAPKHFEVLFDDEHVLAVNKPSGLPTLPGSGFLENTLLRAVQKRFPGAHPVHRLGRATSGIVLFAKSQEAAARLSSEWNTSQVRKVYCAVASGRALLGEYDIVQPIGLVPHPRLGSVWAASQDGKPSRSVAQVVQVGEGSTVFKVTLHSGRPHQIRIHLASIGHPLVGDPLYGADGLPKRDNPGLPGDGGYLLHALQLCFAHPVSRRVIDLEAALPATFALGEGVSGPVGD